MSSDIPIGLWKGTREPMLTVASFKARYLWSIDLSDLHGNIMPDEVIQSFIDMATDYIETFLNVPIKPIEIEQFIDYDNASYQKFGFLQVPIYPLKEVTEVTLQFTEKVLIKFPTSWYKVYHNAGQIQLLPDVSTLSAAIIVQAGQLLPRAISGNFAPQLCKVKGFVGLGDDNDCIPPLVNQAVGLYAALQLLQMIGDIGPGGPGVNNSSLSLDGMSQSTSNAISATNNLYGATITKYEKLLEKNVLPTLKKKYKRISLEYL